MASKKPITKRKIVRPTSKVGAVPATQSANSASRSKPRIAVSKASAVTRRSLLVKRKLRVHAIPLSDDDGKRAYTFTADNLAKGLARANLALAGAGIELVFDASKDWHPRKSTVLNNLQNGGSKWWVEGNKVADRLPGKIVIFFRHGVGSTPVGWGHAYPPNTGQTVPSSVSLPTDNVNYVAMPNALDWDTPDRGNFLAHEVGHYLGLFHTHPGWGTSEIYKGNADTAAKAEQRVIEFAAANGGTVSAFNGDLLSDTNPDCCRDLYSQRGLSHTSAGPASVSVSGKVGNKSYSFTLTPPRDNVMSYFFWGAPQRLTASQAQTIHQTLQHEHRRVLIEPPCNPDFHNLDYAKWQRCFDYWNLKDLSPSTLSVNRVGSKTLISGSFQPGPSDPVWTLMTGAKYQERFDEYAAKSYRPDRVIATQTASGVRYSAIWKKAEAAFEASHGMTPASFEKRWAELHANGWLHTDLFLYKAGSKLLVSSTWVKSGSAGNACYFDMTADAYQKRFDDFWKKGLRVTTFSAYPHGSGYRYAAIWQKQPGRWGHWFGLTSSQYQAKYDEMAKAGLKLHQVQAYGTRFSGIWKG